MNTATIMAAIAANEANQDRKREAAGPGFAGPPPQGPLWRDLVVGLGVALVIVAMLWSYVAYVQ